MRSNNIINTNCCAISQALVLAVLGKSNLHWEMHHAQVFALEMQAFSTEPTPEELTTEVTDGMSRELTSRPMTITLMGLPVAIDNVRYPKSLVRLMSGAVEIGRLEQLAVPNAFFDASDYTDEGRAREIEKYAKLTYE